MTRKPESPKSAPANAGAQANANDYPRPLGAPGGVPRVPEGERWELTTAGRCELAGPRADDPCGDCGRELGPVYHELLELNGEVRRDGYRCADCQAAYLLSSFDSVSGHVNNAAQIIGLARNLGETLTGPELGAIRRRLRAALYLLDGAE